MTDSVKSIDICDVPVSSVNIPHACEVIDGWIAKREKVYVCVAPVSTVVDCQSDREYMDVLQKADMVTPDGIPLVWIAKMKGDRHIDRTYGPDLMLALCDYGQNKGHKHYFYGATESTCRILKNVLKDRFPDIIIIGEYAPPYSRSVVDEDQAVIDRINALNPDILWVGLGSPKQDFWMVRHRSRLNVPVMIGVGAAFDFIAGVKRQAPRWMQRSGLEWLFRLCSEPKRLWKRYLIGNSKFIFLLFKSMFKVNSKAKA